MAQGLTPSGIAPHNRVEGTTERKLYAKVVDNILTARTYASRLMAMAKPFRGKTYDYNLKVTDSALGEFFSGLETLSSAASDTTIELSYAHTAFAQPIVLPMLESFANTGPEQTIDLDLFKKEEAGAEALQAIGTAFYTAASGDEPLGLEDLVDDGTNTATIGGQTRSSYDPLDSTVTASGGTLTLAKMATLDDNCSASGLADESPNIGVTTKTGWNLIEQLYQPQVRNTYTLTGGGVLPVRGDTIVSRQDAGATGGFSALTFRGFPIIKDDAATSGVLYFLNERYLGWRGRTIVPSSYAGMVSKVNLGTPKTIEGVAAAPSKYHGWFVQNMQVMPNQAGQIGRFYVIGQMVCSQFKRQGKLTGITGV